MTPTHVFRLDYVWWMVCGWMASPGLLVLAVQYIGKFSPPEGGYFAPCKVLDLRSATHHPPKRI